MITAELYSLMLWIWVAIGIAMFILLFFISAPYGRHARQGWGPTLSARLGWIVMEAPSPLLMAWYWWYFRPAGVLPLLLLGMWEFHYLYRAFWYPFTLRGAHPAPLLIPLFGVLFNTGNTFFNGLAIFSLSPHNDSWLHDPRLWIGIILFALGSRINRQSDKILRSLREAGEGYQIPVGGMYTWVTAPNYLGEMLIWCGWAIAIWHPAGLAFALWTVANLAPRAASHHRWYKQQFPNYPADRHILIPGLW